ncbi:MAG: polyprenol monophosphomannose synthase [Treponema sp.]|jgi:dolichol-phosphate mannosyltransferase|nr:polyprenol monophosphomannose synthase [Treponema sp.]
MKLLIVCPTYNEIENIESFIPALFAAIDESTGVLIIDDNSPDGTGAAVEKLTEKYAGRLQLVKRPGKQGIATAYIEGFRLGIKQGCDAFLEIDADFSHNPAYIPELVEKLKNHDVAIGSRNIRGGGVEGWSVLRNFVSKGGSLYSRLILGCPVKDLTGGFNMWSKSALEKIGLEKIISRGYSFQIEMKYRAYKAGCSIVEIPIVFVDRKQGKSKMSKKIFFEAMLNVFRIRNAVKKT